MKDKSTKSLVDAVAYIFRERKGEEFVNRK